MVIDKIYIFLVMLSLCHINISNFYLSNSYFYLVFYSLGPRTCNHIVVLKMFNDTITLRPQSSHSSQIRLKHKG